MDARVTALEMSCRRQRWLIVVLVISLIAVVGLGAAEPTAKKLVVEELRIVDRNGKSVVAMGVVDGYPILAITSGKQALTLTATDSSATFSIESGDAEFSALCNSQNGSGRVRLKNNNCATIMAAIGDTAGFSVNDAKNGRAIMSLNKGTESLVLFGPDGKPSFNAHD
ncbi:MAG: hypothetical protein AB7E98_11835 [Pirellulales bacterium]